MRRVMVSIAYALVALVSLRPATIQVAAVAAEARPILSDLKGVSELKTLFNEDVGKVRLVLLVSPT